MAGRPGPKINSRDSSISYPHHSRRIKKQQHSRPFTSSNHSQQRVNPSQTPTFGTRCDSEHSKLQRVLANQLKNDISKASAEGIFCDLELELNHTQTITTHNCIVEARARRFYLRFCCGKKTKTDKDTWRVILPFGVSENLISGFLRNLYKEEDTFNEESFIISHIDECLATSPNYEAYITPQLTPGDISDIPQVRESLKRSSSYYYSLVTLDELDQEKDLLEQELEEQDELIRSFQQIKVAKKPTYLNLSRTSQRTEQTKQLEAFLVEEITPPIHVDPPVQTESSLSSPCSLHTPEEMSRTQDSGMESGLYTTTDETFKSLAPSDTSGVLEDQKANACATMASISDAESDREDLPLEENKVEEKKEKIVKSVEALISLDSLQSEKKSEERDELLIDFSDSPVKKPNLEAASRMKNGKFSEQISKSLLEMQDLIFLQDVGSTQSVEPKRDEPFCLITSIEQDYLELSSIATSSKINSSAIPQFNTYDVNKSSNRSSGNYFIDASSLLDETEIPSTDWMSSKPDEKISIAGVTTSSSSDAPNVTAKNLVTFAAANMESPILITQVQRAQEKRELTEHEQVLKNKLEVIAKYKEEASDPPDRQDIEKKQGSLLFKGSIPAYSKHVTGSEGQLTGNKLEEPPFPSIDFTKVNTTAQDVQTPDSLNGIVDEDFGSHNASVGKECKVGGEKSASIKPPTETPTSSPYFARKLDATAWVVDMGEPVNCNAVKKPKKNFLSSQLATVKLEDQEPENVKRKNSGLGFFVDISDSDTTPQTTPRQEKEKEPEPEEDKKKSSFFYIDIGNGKAKSEIPKKLAERRPFSREVSREEERKDDEIVVKRRSGHSIKSSTNRLSWHEAKAAEDQKKHKRAQSLSGEIKPDGLQKSDSMTKIESGSRQDSSIKDKSEKESCSLDESLICEKKVAAKSDLETLSEYTKVSRTFVRLSDMDNRSTLRPDSKLSREGRPYSKKVEETSWIENKLMVRDSRSSMRSKSPGKGLLMCHSPNQDTDESEMSSMQSSVDRSVIDASTEETDISSSLPHRGGPCSRLGEDLLRMFIEEINTDVVVDVAGRRIKAHKCILSSRCQYFAAMLSGGWVESAGNVISIQGFSFHAVHFALSHIYSGTNNIPDSLSIVELATLTDMLGLEGLKEVIMYTLKVKYCHFFHKPCSVCAVGVLECLPLAAAYGLDEIYHKSLKWITKYFVRIWPSKAFANLPRELVDKCYLQHVVHMSVDNVLDTVMSCDRLLATLPSVRWAEAVYALTSQLLDACVTFMAEHFSSVLSSESLGKELSWNISRLEDSIMSAVDCLPPEQACQSHTKLSRILTVAAAPEPPLEMQWSASFVELLERIKVRVEAGLIRMGSRAMRCKSWAMLASSIRTKVQESACLGHDVEDSRRSRSLSLTKNGKRSRGGSAGSSYGSAPRYQGGRLIGAAPPNLDLRQVTLAMTRGQPVATVQPMPQRKAPEASTSTHHPEVVLRKRQTRGRPSATTKVESRLTKSDISSSRPKSWPQKVMENQTKAAQKGVGTSNSSSATGTRTATPEKSSVPARVKQSSSESSRTSSPAFKDKQRPQAIAARKPLEPMKSASSSHIPVAKPFLSPVLRGSRISDSASSKSVSETRTKNSPIPALRSRIMNRSSQPCLTDRRPSNSSIGGKSSTASSPAKQASNPSIPSSPARKKPPAKEEQRPPFRFGGSSSAERKPNILMERAKAAAPKRPLKGQENKVVAKKVEPLKRRQPMPLSQSSSAPAINKGFKPKLLSNSSRSGTFLKDEPTILKKPVIK
ncbi:uncharacterized protein LOC132203891 isoform X2 [Neocloeon triangulifer]|uniref:uncharacterized protein LOC132203891 isoform X2 n=1 Tax=Neocloeon triangulifer TaxID=2078957 RepID=UPI00286F914A|nr:uncharacterized protein LOC132203891 isoform X2 [Neocloeon triangulifer]